ncbi:periplasmic component of amino acid ABC-type transporter/signal transduction system [Shewanella psychrophila]|uniref:Periplasmic component of amino acid ABC-type transporter/signal transduction system n=1 Tax=Shewanella psychrophila TaxID=225848 RepID=A0A1S6HJJ5_9GAMM|nr:transporter substrate-binding domain-containing protein [Shewanella psychrophila]AQS35683.1 periplasmic component of amino acid ABC-type transporter/signal transduction system [Shewanella psychrophila]
MRSWLCFILMFGLPVWAAPAMRACIDHYPPFQIITDDGIMGESLVALNLLAKLIKHDLVIKTSPNFARCLRMLKVGQVDVVAGLILKPKRQAYASFLPYREDSHYVFISRDPDINIEYYEQLANHTIAVSRHTHYFDRFDQDPELRKIVVNDIKTAIAMLAKERFELLIVPEMILPSIRRDFTQFDNLFKVHPYRFKPQRIVYFGFSRKHQLVIEPDMLSTTVEAAYENGLFIKEIETFTNEHLEWY